MDEVFERRGLSLSMGIGTGIDPRIMKSMLLQYMTPSVGFLSASNQYEQDSSSGIATLFQMMLGSEMDMLQPDISTSSLASRYSSLNLGMNNTSPMSGWGGLSSHNPLWAHLKQLGISNTEVHKNNAFDSIIQQAAAKYSIDPNLIHAVIQVESSYNAHTVSHAGAKGLMQLMDGTAKGLGVENSFDPVQNIDGGTKYLAMLLRKYEGQTPVALAAYNAGPGRLDRLGIRTEEQLKERLELLPQETQRYITKVMTAWQ